MPNSQGVFSVLPDNFFSPLACPNRRHYAALLVLYYRLFQENMRGLERELVVREFMNYLGLHRDSLAEEDDAADRDAAGSAGSAEEPADHQELAFDMPETAGATALGNTVDEGLKTEYESHVVNVYSSLCGETVKENGHFMVLKTREEAALHQEGGPVARRRGRRGQDTRRRASHQRRCVLHPLRVRPALR
jgi:hypothetical protein